MSTSSNIGGKPLHFTFSHPCKGDVTISSVKNNKTNHCTVRVAIRPVAPGVQLPSLFAKNTTLPPQPYTHFLEHIPEDFVERLKPQLQQQIQFVLQNHKTLDSAIKSIEHKLDGYKLLKPKRADVVLLPAAGTDDSEPATDMPNDTPISNDKLPQIDSTDPREDTDDLTTGGAIALREKIHGFKAQTEKLLKQIDIQKEHFHGHLKLISAVNKARAAAINAISHSNNAQGSADTSSIYQLREQLEALKQSNATLSQRLEELSAIGAKEEEFDHSIEEVISKLQSAGFSENTLQAVYDWQDQFKASIVSEAEVARYNKEFESFLTDTIYKMCKDEVDALFDKNKPHSSGFGSQAFSSSKPLPTSPVVSMISKERAQAWQELEKALPDDHALDTVISRKMHIDHTIQTDAALVEMLSHQSPPGQTEAALRLGLAAIAVLGANYTLKETLGLIAAIPFSEGLKTGVSGTAKLVQYIPSGISWGIQGIVNCAGWGVKKFIDIPRLLTLDPSDPLSLAQSGILKSLTANTTSSVIDFATNYVNSWLNVPFLGVNMGIDKIAWVVNEAAIHPSAWTINTIAQGILDGTQGLFNYIPGVNSPETARTVAAVALIALANTLLAYKFREPLKRLVYPIKKIDNYGACTDQILKQIEKTAQDLHAANSLDNEYQLASLSKNKRMTLKELHRLAAGLAAKGRQEYAKDPQASGDTLKLCLQLEALVKSLDIIAECRNQQRKANLSLLSKELKKAALPSDHASISLIWNDVIQSPMWTDSITLEDMSAEEKLWTVSLKHLTEVHSSATNLAKSHAQFHTSLKAAEAYIQSSKDQDPLLNNAIVLGIKDTIDLAKPENEGRSYKTPQEISAYRSTVDQAKKQLDDAVQAAQQRMELRNGIIKEVDECLSQFDKHKTQLSELEKNYSINLQSLHSSLEVLQKKLTNSKQFASSASMPKTELLDLKLESLQEHHKNVQKNIKSCSELYRTISDFDATCKNLKSTREKVHQRSAELESQGLKEDAAVLEKQTTGLVNKYGVGTDFSLQLPSKTPLRTTIDQIKADTNQLDATLSSFDHEHKVLKKLRDRIRNELDALLTDLNKALVQVKEIEQTYNNSHIRNIALFDGSILKSLSRYTSQQVLSSPLGSQWGQYGLRQQLEDKYKEVETFKNAIATRKGWSLSTATHHLDKLNTGELQSYYKAVIGEVSETRAELERTQIGDAYRKHQEFQELRRQAKDQIAALKVTTPNKQLLLAKAIQEELDEVEKRRIFTLTALTGNGTFRPGAQNVLNDILSAPFMEKISSPFRNLFSYNDSASKLQSAIQRSNQPHLNRLEQLHAWEYPLLPGFLNSRTLIGEDANQLKNEVLEGTKEQIDKTVKEISDTAEQLNTFISKFVDRDSSWFKQMEQEVREARSKVQGYEFRLPSKWLARPRYIRLFNYKPQDLSPEWLSLYVETVKKITEEAPKNLDKQTLISSVVKEYKMLLTQQEEAKKMIEVLKTKGHMHSAREIEAKCKHTERELALYKVGTPMTTRHISSLFDMRIFKTDLVNMNATLHEIMHRKKRDLKGKPSPTYLQLEKGKEIFGEVLNTPLGKAAHAQTLSETREILTKCKKALDDRQDLMEKLDNTIHPNWKKQLKDNIEKSHKDLKPLNSNHEVLRPIPLSLWDKALRRKLKNQPTRQSTVNLEHLQRSELVDYAKKVITMAGAKTENGKPNPKDPVANFDKVADLKGLNAAIDAYQKGVKDLERYIDTGLKQFTNESEKSTRIEHLRALLTHLEQASELVVHALQNQSDLKSATAFLKNGTSSIQRLLSLPSNEPIPLGAWGTMAILEAEDHLMTSLESYHADKGDEVEEHKEARNQILNGVESTTKILKSVVFDAASQAAKISIADLPLEIIEPAVNTGKERAKARSNARDAAFEGALHAARSGLGNQQSNFTKGALIASIGVAAYESAYAQLKKERHFRDDGTINREALLLAGEATFYTFENLKKSKDEAAEAAILAAMYTYYHLKYVKRKTPYDVNRDEISVLSNIAKNVASGRTSSIALEYILVSKALGMIAAMNRLALANNQLTDDVSLIAIQTAIEGAEAVCKDTTNERKALAVGLAAGAAAAILENARLNKTDRTIAAKAAASAALAVKKVLVAVAGAAAVVDASGNVVPQAAPMNLDEIIAAIQPAVDHADDEDGATPTTIAHAAGKAAAKATVPQIIHNEPSTNGGSIRGNLHLALEWLNPIIERIEAPGAPFAAQNIDLSAWKNELISSRNNMQALLNGTGVHTEINKIKSAGDLLIYADKSMRACNKARHLYEEKLKQTNQKLVEAGLQPFPAFPSKVNWDFIGMILPEEDTAEEDDVISIPSKFPWDRGYKDRTNKQYRNNNNPYQFNNYQDDIDNDNDNDNLVNIEDQVSDISDSDDEQEHKHEHKNKEHKYESKRESEGRDRRHGDDVGVSPDINSFSSTNYRANPDSNSFSSTNY